MTATTVPGAPTTPSFFARSGFVHGESSLSYSRAVEGKNRSLRSLGRRHRDEGKAAGTPGLAIERHLYFNDGAVCSEHVLEIVFAGGVGEIAYVQFRITHDDLPR
jgi:hypothetical protein